MKLGTLYYFFQTRGQGKVAPTLYREFCYVPSHSTSTCWVFWNSRGPGYANMKNIISCSLKAYSPVDKWQNIKMSGRVCA